MARKKQSADTDVPAATETEAAFPPGAAFPPDESDSGEPPRASAASEEPSETQSAEPVSASDAQPEPIDDDQGIDLPAVQESADPVEEAAELKYVPAEAGADDQATGEPSTSGDDEPRLIDPGAPEITTQQVIEAILFTADTPLTLPRIVSLLGIGSARDVKKHIENLNRRYVSEGATFRIEKIAGGYQMLTLPQFNTWLRRLRQSRQDSRFSAAALETLSVVAYKQPVTRADIEAIRGVAAGEMLNRLRELNLIKIVGRAEDVGRPMLYGTTKRFLEVFGLASLDELPQVEQLQIAQ